MDPVIHVEIPADESERARQFYENAFGWKTMPLGPETGDYVMAFTTETDEETRIPKVRGAINGGLYRRSQPEESVRFTVLVDDIRATMAKVEAAGGRVLGDPFALPGVGLFVDVVDTEGNVVQLNQDFAVGRLPGQIPRGT